jgi:hypothetical protein
MMKKPLFVFCIILGVIDLVVGLFGLGLNSAINIFTGSFLVTSSIIELRKK